MTQRNTLAPGTMLRHYKIESVLGQGGFGITYLAFDTELKRKVAIKECFPRDFVSREGTTIVPTGTRENQNFDWALGKFVDEATTLARFRHPGIVQVLQILREENNSAYMILEFVDGQSMDKWLKELGRQPTQEELKQVLTPMIDALQVVHDNAIVHRDIAPDNIYLRKNGEAVLLDFGAAKQTVGQHSRTMNLVVKDGYSAPEQYYTEGRQGPWTDVYSFAAVAYRAMTGKRPVDAMARLDAINNDEPDPIVALGDAAPKDVYDQKFISAVERGLSPQVKARPQSLGEWRVMLLGDEAPSVRSARGAKQSKGVGAKVRSKKTSTPSKALPIVVTIAGIMALAAGGFFVMQQQGEASLEQSWALTQQAGTLVAYETFVRDNPEAPQTEQARATLLKFTAPWSRTVGTPTAEQANAVVASRDRIIVAGLANSDGGDGVDATLMSFSIAGQEMWRANFGGEGTQIAQDVAVTPDGDSVVVGLSRSGSGNQTGFIARFTPDGAQRWLKLVQEPFATTLNGVAVTGDGSIIAVGERASGPAGGLDGWVVGFNAFGDKQWDRSVGGPDDDSLMSVKRMDGGQFAMTGEKGGNFWILSQAENGTIFVDRDPGGAGADRLLGVDALPDGTILAVGDTESFGSGSVDGIMLRLTPDGKMPPKIVAEPRDDFLTSVRSAPDRGVLVAGYTSSRGSGQTDAWLRKYDATLDRVLWERVIGGAGWDTIRDIDVLADGTIVMVGSTDSYGAGSSDIWILRVGSDGAFNTN